MSFASNWLPDHAAHYIEVADSYKLIFKKWVHIVSLPSRQRKPVQKLNDNLHLL